MNVYILKMILYWCAVYHVDPILVQSVIQVESGWNAALIGEANERGLMQLLPSSFPSYTTRQLTDTNTNLKLGIQYLSQMKKQCKYKMDMEYVVCYNKGVSNRVVYPKKDIYYNNVLTVYKQLKRNNAQR